MKVKQRRLMLQFHSSVNNVSKFFVDSGNSNQILKENFLKNFVLVIMHMLKITTYF